MSMRETVPWWSRELRLLVPARERGGESEPWPLTLATDSCEPAGGGRPAPGYQPVGIRPRSRAGPASFLPRSITATQLFVPLATWRRLPSLLTATAFEPLPKGRRASGRQRI